MVTTVASHYKNHLAPIYVWMAGGVEHAAALGASDLAEFLGTPGYAVDLGAGFGMHTIPLARSGHRVLAIDTCRELLSVLRRQCAGMQVEAIEADLQDFALHLSGKADLIVCMGDTLTHLPERSSVATLSSCAPDAVSKRGQARDRIVNGCRIAGIERNLATDSFSAGGHGPSFERTTAID